jgi:predicted hotdog family 3-hydroxylacyl-ACP dehydratase
MNPGEPNVFLPIEQYLPHRGRMVLLDRVLEAGAGRIACSVAIRAGSPFCRNGKVPAYAGIEYMAQAIGTLAGWEARERGLPVKIGFLVSTRRFTSHVDGFPAGAALIVEARDDWRDDGGLGVMNCTIRGPFGAIMAEAQLAVFQPADLDEYLKTT